MKLTFVDTGVLIAAARGTGEVAALAMGVLDDPGRGFASSSFVRLETLPKSVFFGNHDEKDFYDEFFSSVSKWAAIGDPLAGVAFEEACRAGLSAMDSLHVAAAHQTGCDELVTTEKVSKAIHRSSLVPVRTIHH